MKSTLEAAREEFGVDGVRTSLEVVADFADEIADQRVLDVLRELAATAKKHEGCVALRPPFSTHGFLMNRIGELERKAALLTSGRTSEAKSDGQ